MITIVNHFLLLYASDLVFAPYSLLVAGIYVAAAIIYHFVATRKRGTKPISVGRYLLVWLGIRAKAVRPLGRPTGAGSFFCQTKPGSGPSISRLWMARARVC